MTSDGGPAFPRSDIDHGHGIYSVTQPGMSLRDYFAAKAMVGFAACPVDFPDVDTVAGLAYKWADAMLKAREKRDD